MNDISIVYYTANVIPEEFAQVMQKNLLHAAAGIPIISVSHKPMDFGFNVSVDLERSHLNIYKQALIGAKNAQTKYIALCEDDVLYVHEHFMHRPESGKFAYNMNSWNIYIWTEPIFTQKLGGRKNLNGLICERDLFIEAMEERLTKYPDDNVNLSVWAEPGKYERQLGVTIRETEVFVTNPPNVVFSHQTELSYGNLGDKKRLGEIRALEIPYWGTAKKIKELYGN